MRLDPALREAARRQGLGTFAATVLARRGIADEAALDAFLGPAARRAARPPAPARRGARSSRGSPAPATGGERVMVFGDFDADGLTGLAQLVIALRRLGIDADPVRPVAARGGPRAVAGRGRVAAAEGGVDADHHRRHRVHERRRGGRRRASAGIDVIVTDHHHLPDVAAGGGRARQPAPRRLGLPGPRPVGVAASRSPSRGCSSASWAAPRPRRSTSRTSR